MPKFEATLLFRTRPLRDNVDSSPDFRVHRDQASHSQYIVPPAISIQIPTSAEVWETVCMASVLLKSALLSLAPGRGLSACSACIPLDNCLLHSLLICSTWGIYWNLLQVGYSLTVSPVFPLYIM
uniref:Uncharacterized protein n=1 Tax=Molossus molossus TaxID=27622 RepID=A0A7J8CRS5_MOLMO|nr:hypothetical protein HJG59_009799 [Molossus molossus]